MRKILYRGYRNFEGNALYPPDKRWVYGYYYFREGKHWINDITDWKMSYTVEDESVGQFIDLLAKQGKELYEGDIVRNTDGEIFRVDYADRWARYMLSYDGEWCIKYLEDYGKLETYSLNMEVIGNIYENPELLEAK